MAEYCGRQRRFPGVDPEGHSPQGLGGPSSGHALEGIVLGFPGIHVCDPFNKSVLFLSVFLSVDEYPEPRIREFSVVDAPQSAAFAR